MALGRQAASQPSVRFVRSSLHPASLVGPTSAACTASATKSTTARPITSTFRNGSPAVLVLKIPYIPFVTNALVLDDGSFSYSNVGIVTTFAGLSASG